MELREKIFVKICEASVGIGPAQLNAAKLADAILQIPEIKEALELAKPIYIFGDLTEETYGWPGKPDGVRHIKKPTSD